MPSSPKYISYSLRFEATELEADKLSLIVSVLSKEENLSSKYLGFVYTTKHKFN